MATMASFLEHVPSRLIISESGPPGSSSSEYLGLPRAWAIMENLTAKGGIDRGRFSISATGTSPRQTPGTGVSDSGPSESERMVEILLLEWSI
jgi:hypothetical protein